MASSHRNRTPSALEPYLDLPAEQSLVLLTNTLGCSANWLTSRFAASAINDPSSSTSVLLVSWMRDLVFWKDELRRAAGIDVSRTPSFHFLDLLSESLSPNPTSVSALEKKITTAITQATASNTTTKTLLILDYPSLLLATTPTITSIVLSNLLLALRSHPSVLSTLLTTPADGPFVSASLPDVNVAPTPVESESAAFTVQQAHAACTVLSVRELDTGAARDVSGVLRVTKGGDGDAEVKEWEGLYLVGRDGGVKIVE
ncbi:hypothetical protein WHR41_08066 [Cladosporium halotolerans]|uniref:Elongator complex protein 5 n=1 Tax=Cladosporium halotolerans TaxID=1052096 RepID=A0AB34KEG9_9PEZI